MSDANRRFGRVALWVGAAFVGLFLVGLVLDIAGYDSERAPARDHDSAIDLVAAAIVPAHERPPAFGLVFSRDLEAIDNPLGAGVVVFHPEKRHGGVESPLIWVVVDGRAYATNSPSKQVTPSLAWPREAGAAWDETGLDPHSPASELVNFVKFR